MVKDHECLDFLLKKSSGLSLVSIADELSLEQDAERKIGWLFKLIFVGTSTIVAYQFLPYMGNFNFFFSFNFLHFRIAPFIFLPYMIVTCKLLLIYFQMII